MRKEAGVFPLIAAAFLFSFILLLSFVCSQDSSSAAESFNPEKLEELGDSLPGSPEEAGTIATDYLKEEWSKILQNSVFGRVLLKISSILSLLDFFWKPVFGISYSLSWAFIFSVILWLIIFYLIYGPLKAIFSKWWAASIAGFSIASLVGISGVIKKAVDLLSTIIQNTWIAWLSLGIAIIIMVFISYFSGGIKKYLEEQKEKEEKRQTKEARQIIKAAGESAKKQLESFKGEED